MLARYRYITVDGKQIGEHIVVAERALGHPLPDGAQVHHVNGDERDNRNSNLVICQDDAYHKLLHKRARIVRAGGNPDVEKICSSCGLKPRVNFVSDKQNYCRECSNAYRRNMRAKAAA